MWKSLSTRTLKFMFYSHFTNAFSPYLKYHNSRLKCKWQISRIRLIFANILLANVTPFSDITINPSIVSFKLWICQSQLLTWIIWKIFGGYPVDIGNVVASVTCEQLFLVILFCELTKIQNNWENFRHILSKIKTLWYTDIYIYIYIYITCT